MVPRGTTRIVTATLGNDAGAIGAATMARRGGLTAKEPARLERGRGSEAAARVAQLAAGDVGDQLRDAPRTPPRRDRSLPVAHRLQALEVGDDAPHRGHDVGGCQGDHADPVRAHVVEVAAFLARDEVVHDDGDLGDAGLGDRPGPAW